MIAICKSDHIDCDCEKYNWRGCPIPTDQAAAAIAALLDAIEEPSEAMLSECRTRHGEPVIGKHQWKAMLAQLRRELAAK